MHPKFLFCMTSIFRLHSVYAIGHATSRVHSRLLQTDCMTRSSDHVLTTKQHLLGNDVDSIPSSHDSACSKRLLVSTSKHELSTDLSTILSTDHSLDLPRKKRRPIEVRASTASALLLVKTPIQVVVVLAGETPVSLLQRRPEPATRRDAKRRTSRPTTTGYPPATSFSTSETRKNARDRTDEMEFETEGGGTKSKSTSGWTRGEFTSEKRRRSGQVPRPTGGLRRARTMSWQSCWRRRW